MSDCVLCCPGPSLETNDIPLYHQLGDVYAVNRSLRAWIGHKQMPKGVFLVDALKYFPVERPLIERPDILKISERKRIDDYTGIENVQFLRIVNPNSYVLDPFEQKLFTSPKLSTLIAWLYLARSGYKRIYIVGCECRVGERVYFCDVPLTEYEINRRRKQYAKVYRYLRAWNEFAKKRGIESINLSPTSRLKRCMESMSVQEAAERASQ